MSATPASVAAAREHFRRAGIAHAAGLYADSLAELALASQLVPDSPELHFNIGNVHRDAGNLDGAVAAFVEAVTAAARLGRDYPEALLNLGDALTRQGRLDKADEAFRVVLHTDPRRVEAHMGLANLMFRTGDYEGALQLYQFAERIDPRGAPLLNGMALTLERLAEPEQALQTYDRALDVDPDHAETRVHRSLLLLFLGRLRQGFAEYEWRWRTQRMQVQRYKGGTPEWRGEDPSGLTILVLSEQGYGDTIQFSRYLTMLAARGAHVIAAVEAPLVRLIATVPGVGMAIPKSGDPFPEHDRAVAMMSLAHLLDTETDAVPASLPYLSAPSGDEARWRERLHSFPAALRVGLVWTGRPEFEFSAERGVRLEQLAPLAGVPGVSFVSLQQGAAGEQTGLDLFRPGPMTDFADTAALIQTLDLVIATDTSVPHLAGALGKPVWLLLQHVADWRWGRSGDTTPWYPGMRLYRQERRGDWAGVVARVAGDLRALAGLTPD